MDDTETTSSVRRRRRGQFSGPMVVTPPEVSGLCSMEGCQRVAVRGGKRGVCIRHGGGRRCIHPHGCSKAAQGATFFCIAHGGGRRCEFAQCNRPSRGMNRFCVEHMDRKNIQYGFAAQLRNAVSVESDFSPLLDIM